MTETPEKSLEQSVSQRRRLSAIMFTDIKGFSTMMESDEVTAVGLVKAQREIIRKYIALHSGEERETIGDAFLVIFDSAVNAVECAIDIQREIWEYNQTREPEKQVWVRIGIHLGDILIEEGSVFGEGVNLAARVEPLAEPGGICITRQVYDQVKHHLELSVSHLSVRELKNITDIPDIYRIRVSTTAPREPIRLRERLLWFTESPLRLAVTIASAIIVIAANVYWSFFAVHTILARHAQYTIKGPRPLYEISRKSAEKLDNYYKFTKRGSRTIRLEEVKRPSLKPDDAQSVWQFGLAKKPKRELPIHEYTYDGGNLKEEYAYDLFGVLQYKLEYGEGGKVATAHDRSGYMKTFENQIASFGFDYDDDGKVIKIENRNAFGMLKNDAQGAASYKFAYSADGLPVEVSIYDAYGNPVEDKNGVSVTHYIYNKDGLATKETFLDRYRTVRESMNGVAMVERDFDQSGRPVLEKHLDRSGTPASDNNGACYIKYNYDVQGRLTEITSLSCAGSPRATKRGYASRRFAYDGDRIVRESYLDEKGALTTDNRGIASVKLFYDNQGRVAEVGFFGPEEKKTANEDGAYAIHYTYNDLGLPIKRSYLGSDDKPTISANGSAEIRVQYNERGDASEWAYFDTEGNLTMNREGYSVVRNEYDQFGNITSRAFFDKENEPAMGREDNCHQIWMKYDGKGELAEMRCFDGQGKLTPGIKNCAISVYQRDAYGKPTRFECYIADGKFIDAPNLPSVLTIKYDKRGYTAEVRAYDANEEPAERYQGAAIWKRVSDDFGNEIEISTYDKNEKLIDNPKYRAAIFRREYDSRGQNTKASAFDQDGNPTKGIWGFAETRYQYDGMGHKTSTSYFDEKGQPTVNWRNVHEYKSSYDERGRVSEIANLGSEGEPILNSDGIAFAVYAYGPWGQTARIDYLGTDRKPIINKRNDCASQGFTTDDRGNVLEIKCFGIDGGLCTFADCIAITSQEFDAKGMMVKQLFRDAEGNADNDEDGANGYKNEYNIEGQILTKHVLGAQGDDGVDKDGVHGYRLNYRPGTGGLWFMTFIDKADQRARSNKGADLRIFLYDPVFLERRRAIVDAADSGQIITLKCLDDAGNVNDEKECATAAEVKSEADKIRAVLKY